MGTRNQLRWRERRETRNARKKRRQRRRRDIDRGTGFVSPQIDPGIAARGVRTRLWSAILALALTMAALVVAALWSSSTFTLTFAVTFAFSSLAAGVGLLMSARYEEEVHAFAARLDAEGASAEALPPGESGGCEATSPFETSVDERETVANSTDGRP